MIRHTAEDRAREDRAVAAIASIYEGSFQSYGPMNVVDGFITDGGRMTGVYEVKCRNVDHDTYPTVFLSWRKYMALTFASVTSAVSPLFIVGWQNVAGWVDVWNVPAHRAFLNGRRDRAGAPNDLEPIIEVPVALFDLVRYEA